MYGFVVSIIGEGVPCVRWRLKQGDCCLYSTRDRSRRGGLWTFGRMEYAGLVVRVC